MDEAHAALYAAIIGFAAAIIGAAVGGWASWRAARHSADAAVRAAVEQVKGQAKTEHDHWVRQERRRAYGEVTDAFQKLATSMKELDQALSRERPYSEHLQQIQQHHMTLILAGQATVMLGPNAIVDAAKTLTQAARDAVACRLRIAELGLGPGLSDWQTASESLDSTGVSFRRSEARFAGACQRVLLASADS
ncbi:hypothetical protein [Streptomyces kronopolitis]|uniref:hypothetical protein n=1 Tax=Streptomyces kronopolitis TaxID=1612435 RepID=UPI0034222C80